MSRRMLGHQTSTVHQKQSVLLEHRSSPRSISTAKLKTSPSLHMQPIYQVVFLGPYLITQWDILSQGRLHA